MEKLTKRQLDILEFVRNKEKSGNDEIREFVGKKYGEISRVTIVRELDALLKGGYLAKSGQGRAVVYSEKLETPLLRYFDPEKYFQRGPDERAIAFEKFNPDVFNHFSGVFSASEIGGLEKISKQYQKRIKKLSIVELKKEWERLTIELSWKSSKIEGNTYSLIDTEILIKEHQEAKGHKKEEATMILNHKAALDYIFSRKNDFKKINIHKIENIHSLIVRGVGVSRGLRRKIVGVTGTKYLPLDNYYQIREAMEEMVGVVNKLKDPLAKAFAAIILLSYIQPFEDGNKRTARLLGNAILIAYGICPLSYRSINETDYKKATLLFYEQNSARFFKELFIKQYKFSVENYFLA